MKKFGKFLAGALLAIGMVALSSCSMISNLFGGDDLAGNTYSYTPTEGMSVVLEFGKKNAVTYTYTMTSDYGSGTMTYAGTYAIEDDKLTLTFTSGSSSYTYEGVTETETATADDLSDATMNCTYEIDDDKNLVLTSNGQSITFKKVKK